MIGIGQLERSVHVGDLVELVVDGKFFQRSDGKDERYAGYVASISGKDIQLSPTPQDNLMHGYVGGEPEQKRVFTKIEVRQVKSYRVL